MVDKKRFFEYLDKMGVSYTLNTNPTIEEIERIKKQIKKNLDLLK